MGLFSLPERKDVDIHEVFKKTKEVIQPKITITGAGNTLLSKLKAINKTVSQKLGEEAKNFVCITDDASFIEYCKTAIKDGTIAIDTETTGLDFNDQKNLVGLCIYSPSQKPAYVPVGHISAITETKIVPQVSIEAIIKGIKLIKESNAKLIWHNAYYDLVVIYLITGIWLDVYWDTMIASHVLNENESHSLKDLYIKYVLDGRVEAHYFGDLFEGIPVCYIPYDTFMAYGAKDAKMTMDLYLFQKPYLTVGTEECTEYELEGVSRLYFEDLLPMLPVLVKMKITGMKFDFEKAKELKVKYNDLKEKAIVKFNKSLESFKDAIKDYNDTHMNRPLPYPLNYNSSEQIRVLFYDIAKIGVVYQKEPKGTGKNVMNAILKLDKFKGSAIRNVVECLLEVKMYDKALSGFIEKLTETAIETEGIIHSNLNLAGTDTGRLSCSNPNQQQIPSKLKDIRQMFTAGEGRVLISCDFSRQEPCILASTCKDPKLIEAFHSGLDVYSQIASMMYNNAYEDNLEHNPDGTTNKEGKERRSAAKKVTLSQVRLLISEMI